MGINKLSTVTDKIPITVDSVKNIDTYRMTRCTYFSIENCEPAPGWTLQTDNVEVSFLMMGLSGVILSPLGDDQLFDTADKYDHLFQMIEKKNELYVEMNDIWIPNELFYSANKTPERGDVFRVGYDLFKAAYILRDEANSDKDFLQVMEKLDIPLVLDFSENETDGLKLWNEKQIKINQEHYHENSKTNLPKKENDLKP